MKQSEKEVKESKEIRTRSRETDVRGDSTTWNPPGLRNLLRYLKFFWGFLLVFTVRQQVLMAQECPLLIHEHLLSLTQCA